MVAAPPSLTAPAASDEKSFLASPLAFCAPRAAAHGAAFTTRAFGDATFVGDAAALAAAARAPPEDEKALRAPFASARGEPFGELEEAFNAACYECLFEWIPRYKEAGFSTFRFEDFIDGRVRKMMSSARELVLKAASPALFGQPYAEAWAATRLVELYQSHAEARREEGGVLALGRRLLRQDGTAALREALAPWAARRGVAAEEAVEELTASVEQTAALLCNMIAAAQAHPAASAQLAREQAAVLKGSAPRAPITAALLGEMPFLEAFTCEVLRTAPPARPHRFRLSQPTRFGGLTLPAGALIAPEPFVAASLPSSHADPLLFDPSRFAAAEPPPTLCFGGAARAQALPGDLLTRDIAKAAFVQLRRMFEEVRLGADPPPKAGGYPLHTLPEASEVLLKPKMYYELQRGVKKLRF
ncbi:hypothetical protein AB1Y20_017844 [Prymnesium parvum]|uniref:Uncharacterized protein n=1 Tax=Prymnesium parvum TaxID=97485 RepID=A0AB34JQH4_PRYPA